MISQDLWFVRGRCVATKFLNLNDGHPMVIHDRWQRDSGNWVIELRGQGRFGRSGQESKQKSDHNHKNHQRYHQRGALMTTAWYYIVLHIYTMMMLLKEGITTDDSSIIKHIHIQNLARTNTIFILKYSRPLKVTWQEKNCYFMSNCLCTKRKGSFLFLH